MTAPDERNFTTFTRGHVRDNIILESYRNSLRNLVDPATGQAFTEDEIQRATQPGTRFYIEADSVDLLGMSTQQRALYFSDQIDPRRANTGMLEDQHGRSWLGPDPRLDAVGASGVVDAPGAVGSIYIGSTTLGDPNAAVATDPNGVRYQVLVTSSIAVGDTSVTLPMQGVLTDAAADGFATNLEPDTVLTWSANAPIGTTPTATVNDQTGTGVGFTGGFDQETDQELAARVEERTSARPASGNPAHIQAWARQGSVATEQAYVYPTAFQAGSVLVAITQKRNPSATDGPLARVPSVGLLSTMTSFLTPPGSPVVPQRAYLLVVPVNFELADQIERVTMSQGVAGGWHNVEPWPSPVDAGAATEQVRITTLTDQLNFTVTTTSLLLNQVPGSPLALTGDDAPSIMVWDRGTSRFERLLVSSITHDGTSTATVVLAVAPTATLVDNADPDGGSRISPYTDRAEVMATGLEEYFDSLGPGEVVATTDPRFARAARNPRPQVKFPLRAGQTLITVLLEALGGTAPDGELTFISQNEPTLPTSISTGPNIVGLGHVNIYPLV